MGWRSFYEKPFSFVDNLNLSFKIRSRSFNLNFFQKYTRLRKSIYYAAIIALAGWIAFGFDSTPLQFIHALYTVPDWILGNVPFGQIVSNYQEFYGKEMHYSAFFIYGIMVYTLSRHFEDTMGWTKSRNIAYSFSLTFFSIGIFEFFWMFSFAVFQGQPWVINPAWPQLRIILQNFSFLFVGVIGILYIWADSYVLTEEGDYTYTEDGKKKRTYCFRWDRYALAFILLTIAAALLWIYYPGYIEPLSVTLKTGEVWSNSNLFPQTLYTVDLDPFDAVNAGEWFWLSNTYIHFINTLVKAILTLSIAYISKVKKL